MSVNYAKIPVDYMVDGVRLYIERGIPPGHFLTALFSNDLKESFKRADDANTAKMREWVGFVYWEMPWGSQGSPAHVSAWIDAGGLEGHAAKARKVPADG